jgi:hypothetical protein
MYSYVPTSGKVPESARNKSPHVYLRSVQRRRFRRAIDYIVGAFRPLSPKAMKVVDIVVQQGRAAGLQNADS